MIERRRQSVILREWGVRYHGAPSRLIGGGEVETMIEEPRVNETGGGNGVTVLHILQGCIRGGNDMPPEETEFTRQQYNLLL